MAQLFDELPPRAALVAIAYDFHARGWMAGTAGNLSAREDNAHFWITASGKPKGRIDESDFLLVRVMDGVVVERPRPDNKPSAETSIHAVLYRIFPQARACLHGHLVESCLAADRMNKRAKCLRLPSIEMLKGFDIWEQNPKVDLPVFENHLDVPKIAKAIESRFKKTKPELTAFLIDGHGPTVWGASLQEAYNRFETLEFILRYLSHTPRR